jgi:hypothetical protein
MLGQLNCGSSGPPPTVRLGSEWLRITRQVFRERIDSDAERLHQSVARRAEARFRSAQPCEISRCAHCFDKSLLVVGTEGWA